MFKNVSCLVSPPNGLKPLKRTYANTPIDQISVLSDNGSYDRTYVEIIKNRDFRFAKFSMVPLFDMPEASHKKLI